MQLTHERLRKHPHSFTRISSLSIKAFDKLVSKIVPSFDELKAKNYAMAVGAIYLS